MALNVTTANLSSGCGRATASPSLVQWDRGQILQITGVELPAIYQVEFCNPGDAETVPMIGNADGVEIPNSLLETGLPVLAYIVLHEGEDDRETKHEITVYVAKREKPGDVEPDPGQQGILDQLIEALDAGVESAEAAAQSAKADALKAEGFSVGEQNGVEVGPSSPYYQNNAEHYANVAQQGAEESGYAWFDVHDDDGEMYVTITPNLAEDVSFLVDESIGILEVTVSG